MSNDLIVEVIALALMLSHVAALVWAGWMRRGAWPVVALNLIEGGGVSAWWAPRLGELGHYIEAVWVFVAFEFILLVITLPALFRIRVPAILIWIGFIANTVLVITALVFMFAFRINRLI